LGEGIINHPLHPTLQQLLSSCVTDINRLSEPVGRYCTKFEVKEVGVCDKAENHPCATQIFKIFKHPRVRYPIGKHGCWCTRMAACRRACSNNVGPDPKVAERFTTWFRQIKIPEFLKAMDKDLHVVDMEEWLKKYPEAYRANIRKAAEYENMTEDTSQFTSFPKVNELQFNDVDESERFTSKNEVKERQINCPPDEKKFAANAFINILEGIAHKHIPSYCGRKNWIEICSDLEGGIEKLNHPIFGAADGKGFDMTQLTWQQKLTNELIKACALHPNVTWNEPLTVDFLLRALSESLKLKVASEKDIYYEVEGRASGDGWTTFCNTILMSSYWEFTFAEFGFTKDDYYLTVKGDDVLFAIEESRYLEFNKFWPTMFAVDKAKQDHGLGQICKTIVFGPIEAMDFLSNHFFYNEKGGLRMTRIPSRVIQTSSWSTKVPLGMKGHKLEAVCRELCYSKGMCLLSWAMGLPIFEELGKAMVRVGRPGSYVDVNVHVDTYRIWHNALDREAYLLYLSNRYGMTRKDVHNIESQLKSANSIDGVLDIPEFDLLYVE
jgi:hypothetical protein